MGEEGVKNSEEFFTGKSFSEALILASTNPQYNKRLFIELRVQYMKITSSEPVVYINCSECQSKSKNKQFMNTTCSELVIFMYWTGNSMNNLLSYCGLVDAKIRASDIDLPVMNVVQIHIFIIRVIPILKEEGLWHSVSHFIGFWDWNTNIHFYVS